MAGLLHDIGKIGTHDTILDKPGKLANAEYEIVKEHPAKRFRTAPIYKPVKSYNTVDQGAP